MINLYKIKTLADISTPKTRMELDPRNYPYWQALAGGRSIGYSRRVEARTHWLARYRSKTGEYKQVWLAWADDATVTTDDEISFTEALERSRRWFLMKSAHTCDPNPLGGFNFGLIYSPIGNIYTLGHALCDYVE